MNKSQFKKQMAGVMSATVIGTMLAQDHDAFFDFYDHRYAPHQKSTKKCLRCGAEHTHNNCFCSTKCCKLYREEKKKK
jgi:hypothetical protein